VEKPSWIRDNPLASQLLESPEVLARFIEKVFPSPSGKGGFKPAPYQLDFAYKVLHRVWDGKNMFIFKATTRAGKTVATSVLALLMAVFYPNEDVIIVSPRQEQSEILYGHVKRYVESSPALSKFVDWKKPFRLDRMHLKNGSIIRALSVGNPGRILGFGASTLIIDESAEIPDDVYYQHVVHDGLRHPPGERPGEPREEPRHHPPPLTGAL
jgi:phage terminase large subunit-like protein